MSPVVAAALRNNARGMLAPRQAKKIDALKRGSERFAVMYSLAMRFNGIFRGDKSNPLDAWIEDAIDSCPASIVRFIRVWKDPIPASLWIAP